MQLNSTSLLSFVFLFVQTNGYDLMPLRETRIDTKTVESPLDDSLFDVQIFLSANSDNDQVSTNLVDDYLEVGK